MVSIDLKNKTLLIHGPEKFISEHLPTLIKELREQPLLYENSPITKSSNDGGEEVKQDYYSNLKEKLDIEDIDQVRMKLSISEDKIKFLHPLNYGTQKATTANITYMSVFIATEICDRDIKSEELKGMCNDFGGVNDPRIGQFTDNKLLKKKKGGRYELEYHGRSKAKELLKEYIMGESSK